MASHHSSSTDFRRSFGLCFCFFFLDFLAISRAQLTSDFYASSCPNALSIIKSAVSSAVQNEPRVAASLLRLHVNDCFLQGCDASVLLDDTPDFTGEKTAGQNLNTATGFAVLDTIKSQVENSCPGVVSCADVLAVAARDSVVAVDLFQLGGPSWEVQLGRRDSTTARFSTANIPSPDMNLTALISIFSNKGFTADEMVALSGGHTIGQAKCSTFRERLYREEADIDASFQSYLRASCPRSGSDYSLSPLDIQSSTTFDNAYFRNLVNHKGLLHSDQQLFNEGSTDSLVITYSTNSTAFFIDFANAMVKMGNLDPLTGTTGQIRTNCRKINCRVSDQAFVYEII